MIALYIILSIAVIYAGIRAKHDSYLSHGKWKLYAFIEGVFIAILSVLAVLLLFDMQWWLGPVFGAVFGFAFWTVFDCACGYFRVGDILYIGEYGWDAKARAAWHYNRPFWFFKKPRGLKYLLFKLFVASIIIAGTISMINTYA